MAEDAKFGMAVFFLNGKTDGAGFKVLIGVLPGREEMDRVIIHVDMDAFYAAVEVLDRPGLTGLPVIVGGSMERGVVSSATYEARRFGVRSAMPIGRALSLCPKAVVLPVRMARYAEVSRRVFSIFFRFTPLVEGISIDEAFLDVTGSKALFGDGAEIAAAVRRTIREELGLNASAGVAPCKLVAKMASELAKPNGLKVVAPLDVESFLAPLPVTRLWGVGPAARTKLASMGVRTIAELRKIPAQVLEKQLGKYGGDLAFFARGIDPRPVITAHAVKSVGREETYAKDITDFGTARRKILNLCHRTARRLRRKGLRGETVTLKVKYADFSQVTRSRTLERPTDDPAEIFTCCEALMEKTQVGQKPVRLLGVSVSQMAGGADLFQAGLFPGQGDPDQRRRLFKAVDLIRDQYGEAAIGPAALLEKDEE